jgi:hypothetical protein
MMLSPQRPNNRSRRSWLNLGVTQLR